MAFISLLSTEWIVLVWFMKYVVAFTVKKMTLRTGNQFDS